MKEKILKLKKLHTRLTEDLADFGDYIKEIEEGYEGISRRQNPPPLPQLNTTNYTPRKPDAVIAANKRKANNKAKRREASKMTDNYIKTLIAASNKKGENKIMYRDVTPEMVQLKREQLKLKRGIHVEQKITTEKLAQSWE